MSIAGKTVVFGAEEVQDGLVAEDGFAGFHEGFPLGIFGRGDEMLGAGKLRHTGGEQAEDLSSTVALCLGLGTVVDEGVVHEDEPEGGNLVFECAGGICLLLINRAAITRIQPMFKGIPISLGRAAVARDRGYFLGLITFRQWAPP
jgi:hypothetical protein